MKYLFFVCESLADEPLLDLNGRTPLEAAKTPVMDGLAQKGRMRLASFVPNRLEPTPDVACLSMLGYDPLEVHTGLAPLEAPGFGLELDDRQVIFRADLVSVLDDTLMDATAGKISEREAKILFEDVSAKFSTDKLRFVHAGGYKNYLIASEAMLIEDLDELDCAVPSRCLGQKLSRCLPRGRGKEVILPLIKEVGAFLDAHEINRVRIDLGENPANRLWLWGQGKKPKLTAFEAKHGIKGAYWGSADYVKGIARMIGLERIARIEDSLPEHDFIFFYCGAGLESKAGLDLKSKIKRIEDFDVFIGQILKRCQNEPSLRVCVTGDIAESLTQKTGTRHPVPFLISGEGVAPENNTAFNEKLCGQSQFLMDKGHEFLPVFLKI